MESTPPTSPVSPPSPKPLPLNLILTIISLASLLLSGFFLYQNWLLNQKLQQLISTQQVVTPTPQILIPPTDPTANWKTYTSAKYDYEFKYPPTLEEKGNIYGGPSSENISPLLTLADPSTGAEGTDKPFDGFGMYYVISSKTLLQFVENEKKGLVAMARSLDDAGTSRLGKQTSLQIGDQEAIMLQGYLPFDIRYYYTKLDKGYLILAVSEESAGSFTLFDKILSTFKFTDKNSTGDGFCGGIAGIPCPSGYRCLLDGDYPDAGGKCQK